MAYLVQYHNKLERRPVSVIHPSLILTENAGLHDEGRLMAFVSNYKTREEGN